MSVTSGIVQVQSYLIWFGVLNNMSLVKLEVAPAAGVVMQPIHRVL